MKNSLLRKDFDLLRSRQRRRGARSATDAAYPLRVLRNLRPSCCGSQNLCAALTAASNFDRCHSFLLAASATGGARKRPRTYVRRRVQVACLPNIFAVCQRVKKRFLIRCARRASLDGPVIFLVIEVLPGSFPEDAGSAP